MSKLISTFKIGFDDETKAEIAALKSSLDAIKGTLGVPSALLGSTSPNGGLLAAMVGEAANDAPELLQMGQWVFKGCDPKIKSASVDSDGEAARWSCDKHDLDLFEGQHISPARVFAEVVKGKFDAKNWRNSAISRQPVNDVDYLSDSLPSLDDVLSRHDVTSESVLPQITQADMQLIFIKNLSETLIQRMHSMDRFSEDDYAIGGTDLMAWDIVIGRNSFNDKRPNYAIVVTTSKIEHSNKSYFGIADLTSCFSLNQYIHTGGYVKITYSYNDTYCTITEAELPAFRAALEACYA